MTNKYKEILEDICQEEECTNKNCILKDILINLHTSPRLLMQLRCVGRFKKLQENIRCKEMSWAEVMTIWVETGKAERFSEVYAENKKYLEIYKDVMQE